MQAGDLFLTGMTRSGTTLLEKLLAAHPGLSVLSQPCPTLFIETKRAFLESLGHAHERHPLGHGFRDARYTRGEFEDFLRGSRFDAGYVAGVLRAMQGYSGQYTPIPDPEIAAQGLDGAEFADVLRALNRRLRHRDIARVYGSKEVLCEEYLPYLVAAGFAALLVLRDPRDVIASTIAGRGAEFVGAPRAILWSLRGWRKSVAYALYLRDHPRFLAVRYEELALRPFDVLDRVTKLLGVEDFARDAFEAGVVDQEGRPWGGNSSHARRGAFDGGSIGAFEERLDETQVRYVESVCFPEMRALGMPCKLDAPDRELIADFEDRCATRDDVPRDLARRPEEVAAELARLDAWEDPDGPGDSAASLFLYGTVAARLREAR